MLASVLAIRSILVAILALMAGAGFLATLVSVRLEASGTEALVIGGVATAYFAGLTLGSLRVARIIERVGHIRAFTAFVSLFSASSLAYALLPRPPFWMGLRFVDGLCVAGVFVCIESWLNERADAGTRGTILAAYMIALYMGQSLGQQLLNIGVGAAAIPFVIASILISLAAIPVALTRIAGPALGESEPLSARQLYAISPLGIVGAIASGILLGAFYGLGAVYARRLGLSISDTAWFMSIVIFGGVALQWPLGRLSDRFDRRRIIVFTLAGTVATTLLLALLEAGLPLLLTGALFGGLSFALYPLCVAHTNDHLTPEQRIAASGGLVLLYSAGAAAGPLLGAGAMTLLGPAGLFLALAACAAGALLFAVWRQWASPPVPGELQQSYQVLPRTTPMSATLDPIAREER